MATRGGSKKGEDELQSAVKALVTNVCTSEDFVSQLTAAITKTSFDKFKNEIDNLKVANEKLNEKLRKQEEVIQSIVRKQDKHEQTIRSKNVRLYSVTDKQNEDCAGTVLEILRNKMKLKIENNTIENIYGIGKYEVGKTRPILIKFVNNSYKNYAFSNKKLLKNTKIVMKEDLTMEQLHIMKSAIQKVGNNGKVWTNFGNVFIRYSNQETPIRIRNLADIENL